MTPDPVAAGNRVRTQRVFRHWKQTPGTVLEVDRYFGTAKVAFDNGVTKWVAASILEVAHAIPKASE